MRKRILLATLTAFAAHAAPSQASCLDALTWQGQLYTFARDEPARAGAMLEARARVPGPSDCGPVIRYIGKRPIPLEPFVMTWEVVHSIVGVPPTVAVLRGGKVYRNLAPLKSPPAPGWLFTP